MMMFVLTFLAALATMAIVRSLNWPYWSYHVLAISIGVVLYFITNFLIKNYISNNAPEYARNDEVIPGVQAWELTAGKGVVPKWATNIGFLSMAFFLASPFELFAWLLRTVF